MKITSGVFVLTILASMSTLGVVSTDIETEQQPQQGEKQQQHSWLRHEEQRLEGGAVKADIEEDLEAEYKTLMGPSTGARGTGRSKRARRGANRRLKPRNRSRSCKSSKSDGCDEDEPNPITYIIIAPTPPPTNNSSTRIGLMLADFPRGFPCATGKPFKKMQVNPPTAFNGAYPQLIQKNNGQTENCTMRMLPDELGPAAAASMAGFEMNPENSIMEFSMEVGYRLYGAANDHAEGLAIVIHQDPSGVNAIGGTGQDLGVYDGITKALVIELDTEQETSDLDKGEDNVHVVLVDNNGQLSEVGETVGIPVRTADDGLTEGRIWVEYNCNNDKKLKIYLDTLFLDGDQQPVSPVLETVVDLPSFFDGNGRFFTAGFTSSSSSTDIKKADNADVTSWVFKQFCKDVNDGGTLGNTLCVSNGISRVSVGSRSNAAGNFVNLDAAQSLRNAIDCLGPGGTEVHSQTSHVWWAPQPLELVFDLDREYTITDVLFWNYYEDFYDVDRIDFTFISAVGNRVDYFVIPRDGINPDGAHQNPIIAERFALPRPTPASRVLAYMTSDHGSVDLDFQNIEFVTTKIMAL